MDPAWNVLKCFATWHQRLRALFDLPPPQISDRALPTQSHFFSLHISYDKELSESNHTHIPRQVCFFYLPCLIHCTQSAEHVLPGVVSLSVCDPFRSRFCGCTTVLVDFNLLCYTVSWKYLAPNQLNISVMHTYYLEMWASSNVPTR